MYVSELDRLNRIKELLNDPPNNYKDIIKANMNKILFAKTNCVGNRRFNPDYGIFVNLKADSVNEKGKWTTLFHEIGHNIDDIFGYPSLANKNFGKLLRSDFEMFTKTYSSLYNVSEDRAFAMISELLIDSSIEESHIISDLFGALSDGGIQGKTGHTADYWNDEKINQEAFAHFFSATALNNQKKLEAIKDIFPSAYFEFEKIISELK